MESLWSHIFRWTIRSGATRTVWVLSVIAVAVRFTNCVQSFSQAHISLLKATDKRMKIDFLKLIIFTFSIFLLIHQHLLCIKPVFNCIIKHIRVWSWYYDWDQAIWKVSELIHLLLLYECEGKDFWKFFQNKSLTFNFFENNNNQCSWIVPSQQSCKPWNSTNPAKMAKAENAVSKLLWITERLVIMRWLVPAPLDPQLDTPWSRWR